MLIPIVLFGAPALSLLYFAVSLWRYVSAKRKNSRVSGSVDAEKMQERKSSLIYSIVILATFLAAIIGLVVLFSTSVSFM